MQRWKNASAVVTGAAIGIGAAIVKDLAKTGCFKIAGLDIMKDRLDELHKSLPKEQQDKFLPICCDVTDVKSVNEAFDCVIEKFGGVDVLVNNAGILLPGQLLTMDPKKVQQVVNVNIMGVVFCTQRAFKSMKERKKDGHIILFNSILGHNCMPPPANKPPDHNIYPPTKFAVNAMNEIYRQELKAFGTKIKVTSVSPGVTDTAILPESLQKMAKLCPEDISNGVMYALMTPETVRVHEITIKHVEEAV